MPILVTQFSGPAISTVYSSSNLTSTADNDVASGAPTVKQWRIVNPNSVAVYVKGYDNAAPTVGTTAPNWILPAAAGQTIEYSVTESHVHSTALSLACTTEAGTAGTTSPTTAVTCKVGVA